MRRKLTNGSSHLSYAAQMTITRQFYKPKPRLPKRFVRKDENKRGKNGRLVQKKLSKLNAYEG